MGCYHLLFSFMCPISLICWQTLSVCFSLVAPSALQKEKRGAYGNPSQTCSSTFKGLSCSHVFPVPLAYGDPVLYSVVPSPLILQAGFLPFHGLMDRWTEPC